MPTVRELLSKLVYADNDGIFSDALVVLCQWMFRENLLLLQRAPLLAVVLHRERALVELRDVVFEVMDGQPDMMLDEVRRALTARTTSPAPAGIEWSAEPPHIAAAVNIVRAAIPPRRMRWWARALRRVWVK